MKRYLISLLLFFSFLNASIIKDVEILESSDKSLQIEEIKNSKEFKRTHLPIIRHNENIFFIKLSLDKSKFDGKEKILEFNNEFDITQFEKHINAIYTFGHRQIVNISKENFPKTIYLKLYNDESYINFDIEIFEKNEYYKRQIYTNRFYGVAYGVIFAAFLYYFALFLFNREKSYIYYSLTQLSMLCMLALVSSSSVLEGRLLIDSVFFLFFIFSNLFTKSFLDTKRLAPKTHFWLNIAIIIYVIDLIFGYGFHYHIIEENIPMSTLLIFYLIAGITVYIKGYKPALFYLIGWGLVILSFLFIEIQFYFTQRELLVSPMHLMHLVAPLESLVLAFALAYKMRLLQKDREQQQQILSHQNKLASMGEMIRNIAHQWRQPLTHLSYIMMNLKTAYEKDRLSPEYFDKKTKEATTQLEFMSHTIDDFRDFFKVTKEKINFDLKKTIDEVINLLSASLKSHNIKIEVEAKEKIELKTYKGELLQVIFNILNNAKDELIKEEIKEPFIKIDLSKKEKIVLIQILDNAGGIDEKILDKIFEPYFTTKDKGLGIGLYMSKMIIEKNIEGKLEVENKEEGALFSISIPIK